MKIHKIIVFAILIVGLIYPSRMLAQSEPTIPQVTAMAFTPNDQKMVSGCEDGTIQVWNGEGKLILTTATDAINIYSNAKSKVSRIAISPDGKRIAACMDNYKTYLLDAKGRTIKIIDFYASYIGFSPDSRILMMAYDIGHEVYFADSAGNKVNSFYTQPYYKNAKGYNPQIEICGTAFKPDNGLLVLNKLEMNEKKELYDYWIYDYDSNMNLINKTQIPFNPQIFGAYLSASYNCQKVYVGGAFRGLHEGFIYDISSGSVNPTSLNSGYDQFLTPEGDKMLIFSRTIYVNNIATSVTDLKYDIPNQNYDDGMFASGDKQKVVVAYKNKPLQMHSIKTGKLFDFDDSKTVEDTYVYAVSNTGQKDALAISSNSNIDLSVLAGLKAGDEYTESYGDKLDVDFERGDGGTTIWNITGVDKKDIDVGKTSSFIKLYNLAFKANLKFSLYRLEEYVSFSFWIREDLKDKKGRYENYIARASQDGRVQIIHWAKDKETVLASKDLLGLSLKSMKYENMVVETTADGKISVFINGSYSPAITAQVPIDNDGRPYEIGVYRNNGYLGSLSVTGNNIVKQYIKKETSHLPKTLDTKLTGCVAGDCFYGFGYLIEADGKTEYIGYFKNGVREGLGQIHLAADKVLYNGYFANDMPNGYGCTLFYAKKITEIGTYTNSIKDGDFTTHYPTTTVVAKWKDEVKISDGRQTGCISGDCTNGKGILQNEDGSRIDGNFVNGKKVSGVQFWENGQVESCEQFVAEKGYQGNVDILFYNGEAKHGLNKDNKENGKILMKMGIGNKILFIEGTFENGKAIDITVQFRDGRKWVGKKDAEQYDWATGTGTMTYTDGTTKTGKFKDGEFISE